MVINPITAQTVAVLRARQQRPFVNLMFYTSQLTSLLDFIFFIIETFDEAKMFRFCHKAFHPGVQHNIIEVAFPFFFFFFFCLRSVKENYYQLIGSLKKKKNVRQKVHVHL